MLQMSQIENPRCSAKIDQIRLRRAMNLPVDFQNVSSSGFHSEIQLVFPLLIRMSFFVLTQPHPFQRLSGPHELAAAFGSLRRATKPLSRRANSSVGGVGE